MKELYKSNMYKSIINYMYVFCEALISYKVFYSLFIRKRRFRLIVNIQAYKILHTMYVIQWQEIFFLLHFESSIWWLHWRSMDRQDCSTIASSCKSCCTQCPFLILTHFILTISNSPYTIYTTHVFHTISIIQYPFVTTIMSINL